MEQEICFFLESGNSKAEVQLMEVLISEHVRTLFAIEEKIDLLFNDNMFYLRISYIPPFEDYN